MDVALKFVDQLQGLPLVYKVGLELFMAGGPDFVRELVHRKNRVFLDLKLHEFQIPWLVPSNRRLCSM